MAEDDPTPLEYAGRTPNASRVIDEETRSLSEGCLAVTLLFVGLPAAMFVIVFAFFGCFGFLVVSLR